MYAEGILGIFMSCMHLCGRARVRCGEQDPWCVDAGWNVILGVSVWDGFEKVGWWTGVWSLEDFRV